jgi:hypothetical protein
VLLPDEREESLPLAPRESMHPKQETLVTLWCVEVRHILLKT